jgi:hypothetical protein
MRNVVISTYVVFKPCESQKKKTRKKKKEIIIFHIGISVLHYDYFFIKKIKIKLWTPMVLYLLILNDYNVNFLDPLCYEEI